MSPFYKTLLLILLYSTVHQSFCSATKPILNLHIPQKDSIIQQKTVVIDRKRYTAINILILNDTSGNNKFYIKDASGKIVYTYADGEILSFRFTHFNGDGYKDIVVELSGADSGHQDLIVYDPKSKRFKLAGNCSNAEKIAKTRYYYSYEDCCMGRDWSSNLFYISDSKIINIGYIKYSDGYGLSFYKFNGKKKIFLKNGVCVLMVIRQLLPGRISILI